MKVSGWIGTFMLGPSVAGLFALPLPAQDTAELLNRMKAMEDRVKSLEGQVQALQAALTAATPPQPSPAPQPSP